MQKVVGAVPGLYRLQEGTKMVLGRWQESVSTDFLVKKVQTIVQHFNQAGIEPPQHVVEQGTGWRGLDLIVFYLVGADRIETYDTRRWLRAKLFRNAIQQADHFQHHIRDWQGVNIELLECRLENLKKIRTQSMPRLLRELGVTYRITRQAIRNEIASNTVDLFYSNSVLQRMAIDDLSVLINESNRMLRAGGKYYHLIDPKDFHSITNRQIPELNYLRFSPSQWNWMTSKYLNGKNRLRMPEFIGLLESAGLTTRVVWKALVEENLSFVRRHLARMPQYTNMPAEEIAVSRFNVTGSPATTHLQRAG